MLLIAELWAGWDTFVEIGVIEVVETQVASAEVSMKKLFNMIPRYQG
jgi:hypothetical protein